MFCLRLESRAPETIHLFYHVVPQSSGKLAVEFLAWVETVWGEEGCIQEPILQERNRFPQAALAQRVDKELSQAI